MVGIRELMVDQDVFPGLGNDELDDRAVGGSVAFSTENLFHTAVNLLGLEMDVYRAQDDVLNPRYLPVRKPLIIDVNRQVRPYFSLP